MPRRQKFGRKIVMSNKCTLLNFASKSCPGIPNDPRLIKAGHQADLRFGRVQGLLGLSPERGTP